MGEVIDLEEFRPHEVWREVCAGCGHRSISVAPVGAIWPGECSQCDGECWPECPDCGGPVSCQSLYFVPAIEALMGEITKEIQGCECFFDV